MEKRNVVRDDTTPKTAAPTADQMDKVVKSASFTDRREDKKGAAPSERNSSTQ